MEGCPKSDRHQTAAGARPRRCRSLRHRCPASTDWNCRGGPGTRVRRIADRAGRWDRSVRDNRLGRGLVVSALPRRRGHVRIGRCRAVDRCLGSAAWRCVGPIAMAADDSTIDRAEIAAVWSGRASNFIADRRSGASRRIDKADVRDTMDQRTAVVPHGVWLHGRAAAAGSGQGVQPAARRRQPRVRPQPQAAITPFNIIGTVNLSQLN